MTFPFPVFCPAIQTFPKVVSTATFVSSGNVSSANVSLPSSIVAGNLLLLFVGSTGSSVSVNTPSGFTQVVRALYPDASTGRQVYLFRKTATGSEGATISVSQSTSTAMVSVSYQVSGWTALQATGANGSDANPDPPSLSPAWGTDNCLWLATAIGRGAAFTAFPAGYWNVLNPTPTTNIIIASAHLNKASASEDPGVFTQNASDRWATITTAVR